MLSPLLHTLSNTLAAASPDTIVSAQYTPTDCTCTNPLSLNSRKCNSPKPLYKATHPPTPPSHPVASCKHTAYLCSCAHSSHAIHARHHRLLHQLAVNQRHAATRGGVARSSILRSATSHNLSNALASYHSSRSGVHILVKMSVTGNYVLKQHH